MAPAEHLIFIAQVLTRDGSPDASGFDQL